jgi:hypothetical protein
MGTVNSKIHSDGAGLTAYRIGDAERVSPQFLDEWEQLLAQSTSLYCQYSSPEWVQAAIRSGFSSYSVFAVRESSGALSGLLVWREREITLRAGPRRMGLWIDHPALSIEGDVLLRRPSHPDVLRALIALFPPDRIIQIKSITVDHPAWKSLCSARSLGAHHLRWTTKPVQPLLYCIMASGAGDYKEGLSARRRRHLRQGARVLSELKASQLSLDRIVSPDQVEHFRRAALEVIARSWQRRVPVAYAYAALRNESFLRMLSEQSMLRAYILRAGQYPCAFVLGYQYHGIFHYSDVAYDEALGHASPGILLLHYLMPYTRGCSPTRMWRPARYTCFPKLPQTLSCS